MQCIYRSKYKTAVGVHAGNREWRHKIGELIRASMESSFWGAKFKVTSKNKKPEYSYTMGISFLKAISWTNIKYHGQSKPHKIIQLIGYV